MTKNERVFRSAQELMDYVFPKEAERRRLEAMTTEELAEYDADKALDKVRQQWRQGARGAEDEQA